MNEKKTSEAHLGLPLKQVLPVRLWATPCLWSCSGSETHRCCVDSGRSTCVAKTLKIYEIGLQHTILKCKLRSLQQSEASNCQPCIVKTTLDGQPPQTALFFCFFCCLHGSVIHLHREDLGIGFSHRSYKCVTDSSRYPLHSSYKYLQVVYKLSNMGTDRDFVFIHFHSFFVHFDSSSFANLFTYDNCDTWR